MDPHPPTIAHHAATAVAGTAADHGEGPFWDPVRHRLFWVDMMAGKLHSFDPAAGRNETRQFAEPVCAVAPQADGRLLVAFAKRLAWVDWDSGASETIVAVEPDRPANRCNDGKLDPAGRFWIGTMDHGATAGAGALYRLDDGGVLTKVLDGLSIANGLGWTADARTMFYIDSLARAVWAFAFDPATSTLGDRRTAVAVPPGLGLPDGMTVAPDDTIWVAHWGAGCVCRWDPTTGALLEQVATGCPHTSSCAFGGDDGHRLFITTSRMGLAEAALAAAPHSGALFMHRTTGRAQPRCGAPPRPR